LGISSEESRSPLRPDDPEVCPYCGHRPTGVGVDVYSDDHIFMDAIGGRKTVRVMSRRGEMVARALVTDRVCPRLIFGNFHFPGLQNVNNLTIAALDPVTKIPEYKVCTVRLEPL